MAILKRSALAKHVNRVTAVVSMGVERGHLVSLPDGGIDTDDPTNQAWILKYRPDSEYLPAHFRKQDPVPQEPTPEKKLTRASSKTRYQQPEVKEERTQNPISEEPNGMDKFNLELAKKKADIEKVHGEIRLQKLKEAKLRGEMVPIDLMRTTLEVHTRSIVTAMKDGMEDLLLQVSSEFRGSSEQLSRLRGIVITILNAQVDKSVEATKKQLRVLANDYAERKEVGEHE